MFLFYKFVLFGQLLVFYYTLLSCSCCCTCLICNCLTFCEQMNEWWWWWWWWWWCWQVTAVDQWRQVLPLTGPSIHLSVVQGPPVKLSLVEWDASPPSSSSVTTMCVEFYWFFCLLVQYVYGYSDSILFYVHFFVKLSFCYRSIQNDVFYIRDNIISLVEVSVSFQFFFCSISNVLTITSHRLLQTIRQRLKSSWCISSHVTEVCAIFG